MFTVRGSRATPFVKTQLLLHPIPAVQFVMVGFFNLLKRCKSSVDCRETALAHVCLADCSMNGLEFLNGASIPTGDRCQECTCVVRHL